MSKNIRGLQIEIGATTTGLDKALADVNNKSREANKELREVNKLIRFNPKDTELLSQKKKILGDQISVTREKLDRLKEAEKQVQEQFKKGEITEEQYRAFQREIIETESKLKHYTNQLKEANKEGGAFSKNMEELGGKLKDVGGKISDAGGNLTKKLTVPLVGVGTAASVLGISFEKSMSEVQAVTGATSEDMEQLEKAAREAGATTDKSARDAAEGLKYMGLAGWSVEESQQALMPMLKLSSAANMELGRTSDLVTDTMSALGIEIGDLDGYLDLLAQTSRNSNTDVDQLGEAFLTVGGKLRDLGVDLDESAVALGILGDNGLKGSEAGRGLNAVLTNLTSPTGQAKKALDELNVSVFDSNGEFIGIEESLKLVDSAMEGMTQEQQVMYKSMIAGKEHGKTFGALMDSLGDDFDSLKSDVAGADGALNDMYDTATNNTMGAINNLKSAVEELGLKIFDSLQPHIEKIVGWIQKLTDKFNSLTPEQQEMIVQIGLIVAAIGPALVIIGKLVSLAGTLATAIAFIASPVGLIVLAIAGMIAIGVSLWKNWDKIKEKASSLFGSIKNIFGKMKDAIAKPIDLAKDAVGKAIDKIKGLFNFKFKWPKLTMPKFSISGSMNPVKWLTDGVPKLSVKWNKAGGIFKNPTVIPTLQGLQGFAEPSTGGEAIMPLNKLPDLMAKAMDRAGGNKGVINFYGNYNFRDSKDIDYFMEQAELKLLRGGI